jgi:hypothetical protein
MKQVAWSPPLMPSSVPSSSTILSLSVRSGFLKVQSDRSVSSYHQKVTGQSNDDGDFAAVQVPHRGHEAVPQQQYYRIVHTAGVVANQFSTNLHRRRRGQIVDNDNNRNQMWVVQSVQDHAVVPWLWWLSTKPIQKRGSVARKFVAIPTSHSVKGVAIPTSHPAKDAISIDGGSNRTS